MVHTTEELKKVIPEWLTEEQFQVSDKDDGNSYFNFVVRRGRILVNVVAPKNSKGIIVGHGLKFAPQAVVGYQALGDDKRKAFLDESILTVLTSSCISEYGFGPQVPKEFDTLKLVSKPFFLDSISKEKLISSIHEIHKLSLAVQTILSKYTGSADSLKESTASFYG